MQHITDGDIITAESAFGTEGPDIFDCFKLAADGSRRVLFYEFISDEPSSSQMWLRIHRDQPIPADALGMIAVGRVRSRGWRYFHIRDLQANRAYIGYDFSVDPHSATPVNQIPYALRWRQHVGQIVHDFYTTYAADAFVLENNLSGLSPADVSLTSGQQYSFEIITNQIRKLVGITWGRIDAYAAIRPEGSDTWKAQTPTLQALVHKLCETCRGEGWKIDLIVDREDGRWGSYGADRSRIYYPTRNVEGRWEAGDRLAHTTEERDAHLRHWRNARRYHRNANGDEGDPYLDAPLPAV